MRRANFVLGLGLGLVIAAPLRAQQALPLALDWQAPAECGAAEEVRAELGRIARVRPGVVLPPLEAQVSVERGASGYTARLVTEHAGEQGARELDAPDCPTLVRSVTLVLALAFGKGVEVATEGEAGGGAQAGARSAAATDGEAQPGTDTTAQTPSAAPAEATRTDDVADDDSGRATDATGDDDGEGDGDAATERAGLRVSLLLGAGLELALLPEATGSGALGVELAGSHWSASLRAGAWPGSSTRLAPGLDARFDGLSLGAQGCGVLALTSVELAACGGALAAALRGRSEGAFDDGSDTAPWLALTASASAGWPARSALQLRLEVVLAASLARPRFVITGLGPVHRVPQLAPRLGLVLRITP